MTPEEKERQRQEALKLFGSMGAAAFTVPIGTLLPFASNLEYNKIKLKEAQRMFPGLDPAVFRPHSYDEIIPLTQEEAFNRVIPPNKTNLNNFLLTNFERTLPKFTDAFFPSAMPGAPSPELGSYQQAIGNKSIFPEGDIQAITVTPSPNPSRFAKDYANILADKLGRARQQYEQFLSSPPAGGLDDATIQKLKNKISVLSDKTPGTAGYVWGNIGKPQYSYAEGNWSLGQKLSESNPSIYVSRINADPSKEAKYLFTSDILTTPYKDPRARFTQYEDLGPGTGASWGVSGLEQGNKDISFRKDLIGARGELTTGDLQALLAERKLPFSYSKTKGERTLTKPGDVLRQNLEALAAAEKITPSQAVERFARLVPNVGEPSTPPTSAITGKTSEFPIQGMDVSPGFKQQIDLRQAGVLPPSSKSSYPAFKVDAFDELFNYVYPRYKASTLQKIEEGLSNLIINRDVLRPQAANKLLKQTVANLIEKAKPIKGLGLGGFATGALTTAMDPAVIDALSRGNYSQAATAAATNTAIGSAIGGLTAKGLQALQAAGYARPAAIIGGALPAAGGALAGLGAAETVKALDRAYQGATGRGWTTRNQVRTNYPTYAGPTPTIQPRMGTAIKGGKSIQVPYGSVAGMKQVGRPWWDVVGSKFQGVLDAVNSGSIIGR